MGLLSEPIEKLLDEQKLLDANMPEKVITGFDVAVIGSGYGGAVAAARFAEAGYKVCVLERGNEYWPGDFPNDFTEAPKHFRVDFAGHELTNGYEDALWDVRVGDETVVIVGNALGGGSLINANVAMQPDP